MSEQGLSKSSTSSKTFHQNNDEISNKSYPNSKQLETGNISERPSEMEPSDRITEWCVDPNATEPTEECHDSNEENDNDKKDSSNSTKVLNTDEYPSWFTEKVIKTPFDFDLTPSKVKKKRLRSVNLTKKRKTKSVDKINTNRSKGKREKVGDKTKTNSKKRLRSKIVSPKKPQKTPLNSAIKKHKSKNRNECCNHPTFIHSNRSDSEIRNKPSTKTPERKAEKIEAPLNRKEHKRYEKVQRKKKIAFDYSFDAGLFDTLCTAADRLKNDLIEEKNRRIKLRCIEALPAEKPRKPISAFGHFVDSMRSVTPPPLRKADKEWAQKLVDVWNSLSAPEKALYKVQAIEDIKMYEAKIEIWEKKVKRLGLL